MPGKSNAHIRVRKYPRYANKVIPEVEKIIILPQMRKTFEEIEDIKGSIAHHGFINPPLIARFDRKRFETYIKTINSLWSESLSVQNYKTARFGEDKKSYFYVLIAGERRTRAYKEALLKGEVRFPYEARIIFNPEPVDVLYDQFSENTHMPVPPHEQASAYEKFYKIAKSKNGGLSVASFARKVGRSPEVIRSALRFCALPLKIREIVSDRSVGVSYSSAIELARLSEAGLKADELLNWSIKAALSRKNSADFRKEVSDFIRAKRDGQISLMDIFKEIDQKEEVLRSFRMTVEGALIKKYWADIHYHGKVLSLLESGLLGGNGSPYSLRSPIRKIMADVALIKRITSYLSKQIPKGEIEKMSKILLEFEATAEILEGVKN